MRHSLPAGPAPQARPLPPVAVDVLRASQLFEGLGDEDATALATAFEPASAQAGEHILREGDTGRDFFFVVSGRVRIVRAAFQIGALGPAEYFGEMELVATRPRAASIVAATDVELARLPWERYQSLTAASPNLALHLATRFLDHLSGTVMSVTEGLGRLVSARSLPRRARIVVRMGDVERDVRTGTRVGSLLPDRIDGRTVVAGLADRRPVSLTWNLSSDAALEPLTTAHWEGRRIMRHSLSLLLVEAAHHLEPAVDAHMDHAVGFAQRVRVTVPSGETLTSIAQRIEAEMTAIVERRTPLREEWWTVEEARAHLDAVGWVDASALLQTLRVSAVRLVSYGQVYAIRISPLLPHTGLVSEFRVIPDDDCLLLVYGTEAAQSVEEMARDPVSTEEAAHIAFEREMRAAVRHANETTWRQQRWLSTLGIESVGALNQACIKGSVTDIIRVSEGFHEKRISRIADEIHARERNVRVVCIAGPSASGKSTFIKRLDVQLEVNGIHPVGISLDNYYVDREKTPRDEHGELDFEAFDALQIDLLQDHIARLFAGETVKTARFDFQSGKSQPDGGAKLRLGPETVLLLEGIHGLNPALLDTSRSDEVFRVFVNPNAHLSFDHVTRVHASDMRLIRRIVRDRHQRGYHAAENLARWPSVRAGERKHIFPYQSHADAVFDSSLIFELSVLKVFAERYLLEVPQDAPVFTTAYRLLRMLDRFVTIYPDHVPPTSILREFIGGSGFEY